MKERKGKEGSRVFLTDWRESIYESSTICVVNNETPNCLRRQPKMDLRYKKFGQDCP
jgi:hypothetical protein